MVTTIQLTETTKQELNNFKTKNSETYEDVILKLIKSEKHSKIKMKQLLKEGYLEMAGDLKQIEKDWSKTGEEWD